MSAFAVDENVTVAKLNQKLVLVDTGDNINAATKYAGMLAFCTVSGSGLNANTLYQRNSANSAWITIAELTSTQTLTGKTISASNNTITNLPGSAFANASFTLAKLATALTKLAIANSSSSVAISGTDITITGMNVLFTTTGGKAGLLSIFTSSVGASTTLTTSCSLYSGTSVPADRVGDLGGSNSMTSTQVKPFTGEFLESAPAAGSTRRLVKASRSPSGTATYNPQAVTNGLAFIVIEVL